MNIGGVITKSDVVLGPMAGVTDKAFRDICKSFDVGLMVTEMVSSKALYYGDKKTAQLCDISPDEGDVALQIFGSDPKTMAHAVETLNDHINVIIDINMGCPAPKIVKNGDGSALMKNPELACEIASEVVRVSLKPVTVKIRKGWDDQNINAVEFAKKLEQTGISALTIHGRTREEFYSGEADWEIIRQVKNSISIPVIGNGDVFSVEDAINMKKTTNCDGVMVARGVQGNPWLLKEIAHYHATGEVLPPPTVEERVDVALRHFELLLKYKGERIGLYEMRKHAAWYVKGLEGSAKIRSEINRTTSIEEVRRILNEIRQSKGV